MHNDDDGRHRRCAIAIVIEMDLLTVVAGVAIRCVCSGGASLSAPSLRHVIRVGSQKYICIPGSSEALPFGV